MSQPNKNLRLRRTQKLLREALIELIEERRFESLTVGEITRRAMVSRAAFYRNYEDKYDLVEQIFTEAVETLTSSVLEADAQHPPQNWVRFFEHIAEFERLYRALLGRNGSPWFVHKMREFMINVLREYDRNADMQPANRHIQFPASDEFIPSVTAALLVEAITWWLEHGRPYTSQQMMRRCALLVSAILKEKDTWQ